MIKKIMEMLVFYPVLYVISIDLSWANGDEVSSYVEATAPFVDISDVGRQAEVWATCVVTYEILEKTFQSKPAQAKQLSDFGNGAQLAVMMVHMSEGISSDLPQKEMNALWSISKVIAKSTIDTRRNWMAVNAENIGEEDKQVFFDKVVQTGKICIENLEDQQGYIDAWRDLAKSGLLVFPEN
jgi:hypothetical protein